MAGVFISYRREDSRGDAGRFTKDLREYLEEGQIFRDIDAVEAGTNFIEAINKAISSCSVLIAIIGPNWLSARDKRGHPRLADPQDYVRVEIEAALNRNIRVIPLLVGDASMPTQEDLPESLSPLAQRQAHELSENRWDFDVGRLAGILQGIPGIRSRGPIQAEAPEDRVTGGVRSKLGLGRFAGAVILSAMGVLFLLAALVEGQDLAFMWAAAFLGAAYWLYARR